MRLGAIAAALLTALLISSIASLAPRCHAQPTWSFKVELLPSELYMGEWGTIQVNLTNMDCSYRTSAEFEFEGIPEQDLEELEGRAVEMFEKGLIGGYDIQITYAHGVGGQLYYDAKLTISGACSGNPIKIYYVFLWFPWKDYPGRELGAKAEVNEELKAFDPIEYILDGVSPGSSKILTFNIFIPPDIRPEEKLLKPYIDIRVHYPGWIDYTLEGYPTEGPFEIQPYRSFNLTITDYDGVTPIAEAKVVIRRLMYYYEKREYVTPENGTISIHRLLEDYYEIRVYWNSSDYLQESQLIHIGKHHAYELASSKTLKTLLFNVEIRVLDLRGRPLDGAEVLLDGVKRVAEKGLARYPLVPNGNHTLQACWMSLKLLDEWIWVGYHPTLFPEIKKPKYEITLQVGDLVVQAVDSGGSPIGANFTVIDLSGRLPSVTRYSRSGFLNISRIPLSRYLVKALNCSKAFGTCVEASGEYSLGGVSELRLPVHLISFKVYSMSGLELANATISFGPVSAKTDESGSASFPGVPEGEYLVKVFWKDIEVYRDRLKVTGSVVKKIHGKVYDVMLKIRTADGDPFAAKWVLVDPSGRMHAPEAPTDIISLSLIPAGSCELRIFDESNVTVLSKTFEVEELAELEALTLPIKNLVVKAIWEDGSPISGAKISLSEIGGNKSYESVTSSSGEARFDRIPYSRYSLTVYYPRTSLAIIKENVTFSGDPIEVEAKQAQVQVKVVDWLDNPLRDALVRLHVSGIVLGELRTRVDGVASFSKLPNLPAYQLEVKHGPLKVSEVVHPGQVLAVKLGVISFFGLTIYVSDVSSMMPYIVGAAVVFASIAAVIAFKAISARRKTLRYEEG